MPLTIIFFGGGCRDYYSDRLLAVQKTGELGADDEIEILARDENKVSVTDIVRLYVQDKDDI